MALEPPFTNPLSPRLTEPKWNPVGPQAGTATVRMSTDDGVPSLATVTTTPALRVLVMSSSAQAAQRELGLSFSE